MSFHAWTIFAVFWLVFVTSPGPNAVNCVTNGMTYGFRRAYWGVLGILTQASLFLCLSALGVTALIAASPQAFFWAKLVGAAFLIWTGIRSWINARRPLVAESHAGSIYGRAFAIGIGLGPHLLVRWHDDLVPGIVIRRAIAVDEHRVAGNDRRGLDLV